MFTLYILGQVIIHEVEGCCRKHTACELNKRHSFLNKMENINIFNFDLCNLIIAKVFLTTWFAGRK